MNPNSPPQKTLTGYHDKSKYEYTITTQEMPILIDEVYSPFLVTQDHNYTITTKELSNLINSYRKVRSFQNLKRKFAQVLIIPGLVVSVLSILISTGLIDQIFINRFVSNKLLNLSFWVAMLGVIILWHDYYRRRRHPIKIPTAPFITEKELADIKSRGIQFERKQLSKIVYYLDEESQNLLVNFTTGEGTDTFELFKKLLSREDVQHLIERADLNLSLESLGKYSINKEFMPKYPLPSIRSVVMYAMEEAILSDSREIKPIHFFLAYMKIFPILRKYIKDKNSSHQIMREIAWYMMEQERKDEAVNLFNINYKYFKNGGIANSWIYGYTFHLNKFSKDLNQSIAKQQDIFGIGHKREVDELVSVVGRLSKNNALLVGEPGVGKSSLIKGVAQRINWGDVPNQLRNKRIIQLDINSLLALAQAEGNLELLVQKSMAELTKAGNTILYIDEIQEIVPTKAAQSGHTLAGILLPYILDSNFPIVGSINYADYKKHFYDNESLRTAFELIEVAEVTPADTMKILLSKIEILERNFGLFITFPALANAIELSSRYILERKLPDSAVATVEAACSWAQSQNLKKLGSEEVAKSVALTTNIPVDDVSVEEATRLMNLEENMRRKVIGQDEAVHNVVEALKRARADIRDPNKPIGVFLFLGPTGTGKTHLSKTLAKEYFGSQSELIRIDMSEYQEISSINKILGYPGAVLGQVQSTLLDKVKSQPFSVVLFDEIEKAHPQVLDLFLQLFDEGRLTNNNGETVNFTNCILICTSNIGSRQLMETLEKGQSLWQEAKQSALMELRGVLRPELLNRFDSITVFSPHDINNLVQITTLILTELSGRMRNKGLTLEWEESIPMLIANKANEPGMGARPIKRFIQERIEAKIADEIISKSATSGDTITIKEAWLVD